MARSGDIRMQHPAWDHKTNEMYRAWLETLEDDSQWTCLDLQEWVCRYIPGQSDDGHAIEAALAAEWDYVTDSSQSDFLS